jgi:hypothetical protein
MIVVLRYLSGQTMYSHFIFIQTLARIAHSFFL